MSVLLPKAAEYRRVLDEATLDAGWEAAAAVTTLFVEGTQHERTDLASSVPRPLPPLEAHPLVKHYGLSVEHLALTKAHRQVEGDHRRSAWRVVLDFVGEAARPKVVEAMQGALQGWLAYRDEVAEACGVRR
ncbi:MAG: hypothetical protein QM756_30130 [Polyangiaceae bacterium]